MSRIRQYFMIKTSMIFTYTRGFLLNIKKKVKYSITRHWNILRSRVLGHCQRSQQIVGRYQRHRQRLQQQNRRLKAHYMRFPLLIIDNHIDDSALS